MTQKPGNEGAAFGAGGGTIQLYCNPATSEITGEYRTFHEAIDVATPSTAGALLICDGVILATAAARGWLFEQPGIERLHNEFHAATSDKAKAIGRE